MRNSARLEPATPGIFLGLIRGRILATSQLKNEQKLLKMVHIIPNFLVLYFCGNFMKMSKNSSYRSMKICKNMFSFTFYTNFIKYVTAKLYTANFNLFKLAVKFF